MLSYGDNVVLGLSGGADSMCLLHILLELRESYGLSIVCAHVNHGIRQFSARDEAFVKSACDILGVPLIAYHENAPAYAAENKLSLETAGRELRYQCFERCGYENWGLSPFFGKVKIATAHNRNDLAETVLMRLLRGAGSRGLGGIAPARERFIRPLIGISRQDIENYCSEHNITFVQDETNQQNDFTRNKIRNQLIPHIEREFNPNIIDTLARSAALALDEENFMSKQAYTAFANCLHRGDVTEVVLSAETFNGLHIAVARRVLRIAVANIKGDPSDISETHVEAALDIARGQTGRKATLTGGVSIEKSYGSIIISFRAKEHSQGFFYGLELDKITYIPEIEKNILISHQHPDILPPHTSCKAFNVQTPLTLRTRLPGDKIYRRHLGGSQKIKDYFIDGKIPQSERAKTPMLTCGSDVLWIMDERGLTSDKYTPDTDPHRGEAYATIYASIWRADQ